MRQVSGTGSRLAAAHWLGAACLLAQLLAVSGTAEQQACSLPRNETRAVICEYVRDGANDCSGDAWFPFLECYYCWVGPRGAVAVFTGFVVWSCLLMYVLGTTADVYFAPATVQLSNWLHLRPRVAGVTLLALGNGAPDVFSVLAAYRAGQGDLAVGALVGGSMFVTTVVVGAVISASGGSVKAAGMVLRDLLFNLLGSTVLFFMCLSMQATLWEAGMLFGLYVCYVLAVTQGHRFPPMLRRERPEWYLAWERGERNDGSEAPLEGKEALLPDSESVLDERPSRPSINDVGRGTVALEGKADGFVDQIPVPGGAARLGQNGNSRPTRLGQNGNSRPTLARPGSWFESQRGQGFQPLGARGSRPGCCARLEARMRAATDWDELDPLERVRRTTAT
jgi:hypothetical protein